METDGGWQTTDDRKKSVICHLQSVILIFREIAYAQ